MLVGKHRPLLSTTDHMLHISYLLDSILQATQLSVCIRQTNEKEASSNPKARAALNIRESMPFGA